MNLEFNFCNGHDWFFEGRADEVGRKLYRCSNCGQVTTLYHASMTGLKKTIEPLIVDFDEASGDSVSLKTEHVFQENPYSSFDDSCLKELMRMNIESENYERCAEIRDELQRRQK